MKISRFSKLIYLLKFENESNVDYICRVIIILLNWKSNKLIMILEGKWLKKLSFFLIYILQYIISIERGNLSISNEFESDNFVINME